ncbi:TetR family transcriptional regulator [Fictibacillus macauensis ZFHKF-1]|uniref:TetR family transcriptional regulator n=1 Tax=Fictibacillus macauensis ZFHKF-1 TaxID=1196324 RepID=I8UBE8_9BACL|nr:TetR/AcrR family transcriptional regulator [Fictibacillus macauensis]EIT84108.1 TetR family transcriptional regulator [Fictibacillus macauensis ZFHKF-1]
MGAQQIKEAALHYFAKEGYDGASLAAIAKEAGMKAPSIYAHFKSKDELFLAVMEEVASQEQEKVRAYFVASGAMRLQEKLYDFFLQQIKQYEENEAMRFWLRISFFPPSHLQAPILERLYRNLDEMEAVIQEEFNRSKLDGIDEQKAAKAYIAVLDSILVELLYGGKKRVQERLEASWYMFARGVFL